MEFYHRRPLYATLSCSSGSLHAWMYTCWRSRLHLPDGTRLQSPSPSCRRGLAILSSMRSIWWKCGKGITVGVCRRPFLNLLVKVWAFGPTG